MGRGRQKAKDAKIARQLKYADHTSDLRDLERELVAHPGEAPVVAEDDDDEEYFDRWAQDDDEEDDD